MITLIGKNIAKKGTSFMFYGPAEECKDCRFKSSCVDSLEKNRKYNIKNVLNNDQKCSLHDGDTVVPVEVDMAEITLLADSKKVFEGSTIIYEPFECEEKCEFHEFCFPEGLEKGDKCFVIKDYGKHKGECKKGFLLNKLTLGFVT